MTTWPFVICCGRKETRTIDRLISMTLLWPSNLLVLLLTPWIWWSINNHHDERTGGYTLQIPRAINYAGLNWPTTFIYHVFPTEIMIWSNLHPHFSTKPTGGVYLLSPVNSGTQTSLDSGHEGIFGFPNLWFISIQYFKMINMILMYCALNLYPFGYFLLTLWPGFLIPFVFNHSLKAGPQQNVDKWLQFSLKSIEG